MRTTDRSLQTTPAPTAPRLLPALGPARLTARGQADGAASWADHLAAFPVDPRLAGREVTDLLARHAILGRGGAGFPLAVKMRSVAASKGRPVVVVNAAEGEPAIWKDRTLLRLAPHLVLDGAQLAAAALGADQVHVAVNPTYAPAHDALVRAVGERAARAADLAPIRVHVVPDAFTAGEASAVIRLIDGGAGGRPAFLHVVPSVRGVARRPTLLSNAESFAQLALLVRLGDAYADVGTPDEPGTMLFTVRGAVPEDVVLEAPVGTTVWDLLAGAGGLTEPLQAVLVGGYHGRWMPADVALATPLAVGAMRAAGGALGAGLVAPLPAECCPLHEVARVARYLADQTAGQCGPCVNGLPLIAGALADLARGEADAAVAARIARWSGLVAGRGACKHPDGTVGFVRSALEVFAGHVEAHLHGPCGLPRRGVLPVDGPLSAVPRQRVAADAVRGTR